MNNRVVCWLLGHWGGPEMGVAITLFMLLMNWYTNPGRDKDISHSKTSTLIPGPNQHPIERA